MWPALVGGRLPAVHRVLESSSERDSPPDLPEPRLVRSGGEAEVTIREVVVRICIIGPIEKVEDLEPKLKIHPLRDGCVFIEVDVRLKEIRPSELHRLLVALLPKCGNSEAALGNGAGQPSADVGQLVVTDGAGVVERVAVCVVVAAPRRIGHSRIRSRRASGSGARSVCADRVIAVSVSRCEWICGLEDGCTAKAPATCDTPYRSASPVQALE